MAGDEVDRWSPLTDRMSLIVQQLAEQGYFYDGSSHSIIEPP